MSENLFLPLKKEYFDQIRNGEKVEEYRLVTPYWNKRLNNRQYENIILTCGYPSASDTEKRIFRKWVGCVKKVIIHEHFGNVPVEVYAIDVSVKE